VNSLSSSRRITVASTYSASGVKIRFLPSVSACQDKDSRSNGVTVGVEEVIVPSHGGN
jgi:hypothetical protein